MKMRLPKSIAVTGLVTFLTLSMPLLLQGCSSKPKDVDSQTTAASVSKVEALKEVWSCAMHPQVHMDKPGQCPICGMTLVKRGLASAETVVNPAGHQHGASAPVQNTESGAMPDNHAPVSLSPQKQELIGVKMGVVEKKPLFKDIRAAGRLAFDPDLYTAQNEYIEAVKQLARVKDSSISEVKHSADKMVQSAKLRLKVLGLSDRQIEALGSQESSDSSLLINKPGQDVWVYADIFEMDLPDVRPGMAAEISAGFLGGQILPGKVVSVDRVLNPATRTAKARVLVQGGKTLLRPESYVDVMIHSPLGEHVSVPFDAVFQTGIQDWVFVLNDRGTFEPRLVKIKFQAGNDVGIDQGLQGGETIVTSANFLVDSESRLKAAMAPAAGKPAAPSCAKGKHWDPQMAMCMND